MVKDSTLAICIGLVISLTIYLIPGGITGAQVAGNDDGIGPVCGNSIVETGEQCDDGNSIESDTCSNTCRTRVQSVCGNRVVETGEECDLGPNNLIPSLGCSRTCVKSVVTVTVSCGDGVVQGTEQCDDNNTVAGDGCSAQCSRESSVKVIAPSGATRGSQVSFAPLLYLRFKQRPGIHMTQEFNGRTVRRVETVTQEGIVQVVLEEFDPSAQGLPPSSQPVYAAFEAHTNASVSGVLFTFIVDKTWFLDRKPEDVVLFRHAGDWAQLRTALVAEDASSYFYEAEAAGLSYFIVSVKEPHKPIPPPPRKALQGASAPTVVQNATVPRPGTEAPAIVPIARQIVQAGSANVTIILVVLIVVAIVGGAALLFAPRPAATVAELISSPELDETLEAFAVAARRRDKEEAHLLLFKAERLLAASPPAIRTTYSSSVQGAFNRFRRL